MSHDLVLNSVANGEVPGGQACLLVRVKPKDDVTELEPVAVGEWPRDIGVE